MIRNLGERILTLRKEMNLSQESLAEQIGVSRQAISKWERGEASPDIQNLSALAETFGLTVDEFIHADTDLSKKKSKLVALELKKNAEKLIMIAIAIFILSAFGFILLPFSSKVNILIFGILITAGVLMCVKAGFMFERFYMLNKDYLDQDDESEFPTQSKLSQKKKNAMGNKKLYMYLLPGLNRSKGNEKNCGFGYCWVLTDVCVEYRCSDSKF